MRVAAGRPATIRFRLEDGDGVLVDPDDDALPTVAVLDGAGVTISPGPGSVTKESVGTFSFVLPPRARYDQLQATWSAVLNGQTVTEKQVIEVVGPRLVPLWRLRTDTDLASRDAETLRWVLDGVEQLFANVLPAPVVQEGLRVRFEWSAGTWSTSRDAGAFSHLSLGSGAFGGGRLRVPDAGLPQSVYALSIGGAPYSDSDVALIAAGEGDLVWTDGRGWPAGSYSMWLVNGQPVVPQDLADAGFAAIRHFVRRLPVAGQRQSRLSERISSLTTAGATMVFKPITPERPTGLDEVDAVLNRYQDDEAWI